MKTFQRTVAFALIILLGLTGYGLYQTSRPVDRVAAPKKGKGAPQPAVQPVIVDTTPLKTAQDFAQIADTEDEQVLAKEALRLADFDVDLAYSAALHEAKKNPPLLSADARDAKDRLAGAQKVLAQDDALIARLNAEITKTPPSDTKDRLAEQLDGVEADRNLAEDEADDAQQDFERSGGDIEARIQQAQKDLKTAQRLGTALPTNVVALSDERGLIHRFLQWSTLHSKQIKLWQAKQNAENAVAAMVTKHDALEAKLETEKEKSPELAHHARSTTSNEGKPDTTQRNLDSIVAVADKTWKLAYDQQLLAAYDKSADTSKQLAATYASWIEEVSGRQRAVLYRALIGIFLILAIALVALFFNSWMAKLVGRLTMDRRQLQTLQAVTRVTLQILAVLFILLVIFGPPTQLGTFIGLATAGLTVALKDFIIGFLGWFVLMGKNGIRLGDWVEINGVTGQVVETGMFHTVLLETGNWTDSGHPTGRRVTFTNSFAIEGHYFNFSTSGQWLWDELQITIPSGRDPFPLVAAIRKIVLEATEESAKQAELEWQRAAGARDMASISATPAISVRPGAGGIDVQVRYVTRANERYQLRSRLYQSAVELLGGHGVQISSSAETETKPA